ncbi:hypothetical protein PR048_014857 [Dryococelus australis]|uniref:Uncharacterized protein n=1 Tax=Dryococelus australis TaxID=614101 RepID=A0ABQ9HFC2_9NEOP|nr:hypothetical protein PR048_014857 [Dryococelus australis]
MPAVLVTYEKGMRIDGSVYAATKRQISKREYSKVYITPEESPLYCPFVKPAYENSSKTPSSRIDSRTCETCDYRPATGPVLSRLFSKVIPKKKKGPSILEERLKFDVTPNITLCRHTGSRELRLRNRSAEFRGRESKHALAHMCQDLKTSVSFGVQEKWRRRIWRLLIPGSREPTRVKRGEYGAPPECKSGADGITPRKLANQPHHPARASAKIKKSAFETTSGKDVRKLELKRNTAEGGNKWGCRRMEDTLQNCTPACHDLDAVRKSKFDNSSDMVGCTFRIVSHETTINPTKASHRAVNYKSSVHTRRTQQEPVTIVEQREPVCTVATHERAARHPLNTCCNVNCTTTMRKLGKSTTQLSPHDAVWSSDRMKGRGKREIPEKTRQREATYRTIPTWENKGSGAAGNRTQFACVLTDDIGVSYTMPFTVPQTKQSRGARSGDCGGSKQKSSRTWFPLFKNDWLAVSHNILIAVCVILNDPSEQQTCVELKQRKRALKRNSVRLAGVVECSERYQDHVPMRLRPRKTNAGKLLPTFTDKATAFERLLTTRAWEPMRIKRGRNGAAPGCGKSPRKHGDRRHRPARFPRAKIREQFVLVGGKPGGANVCGTDSVVGEREGIVKKKKGLEGRSIKGESGEVVYIHKGEWACTPQRQLNGGNVIRRVQDPAGLSSPRRCTATLSISVHRGGGRGYLRRLAPPPYFITSEQYSPSCTMTDWKQEHSQRLRGYRVFELIPRCKHRNKKKPLAGSYKHARPCTTYPIQRAGLTGAKKGLDGRGTEQQNTDVGDRGEADD